MKAAFRRDPAVDATALQRLANWAIKARLVSQYGHGGVVIDGTLYHVTANGGYHTLPPGEWTPERWDLFDVGGDDAAAMARFYDASTPPDGRFKRWLWETVKGYDWFSLLAFVGLFIRVRWLHYCFELQYHMITGEYPKQRVMPEVILTWRS